MINKKAALIGLVVVVSLLAGCAGTPTRTDFNTDYLPEFTKATEETDGEAGGIEIPLEGFADWLVDSGALAKQSDVKNPDLAMFWLDASEIIMTHMYWPKDSFKPSFMNYMVIDVETGAVNYPDEDRMIDYTERLEDIVERRTFGSTKNMAKSVAMTALSILGSYGGGQAQVYIYKEYEGEIRNLNTGNEIKYHIKIQNEFSRVTFTTADNDQYTHVFHVPRAEMYLSPAGAHVYFPWGLMLDAEDPSKRVSMWTNYSPVISSCLDAGWNRIAMLENLGEGGYNLRISDFSMPMEEI